MNERIKQLAKQAEEMTRQHYPYWHMLDESGDDVWREKFAELMIRECVEIVEPCKCGCCDGEPEGIITDTIIKQIKEHFGVDN